MDATPPTGQVTLVFTDVEGSTTLWERCPEAMREGLAIHDRLMRASLARNGGYQVKTEGDAFMVSFARSEEAVRFCLDVQKNLMDAPWPEALLAHPKARAIQPESGGPLRGLRVRMGAHLGAPDCHPDPVTGRMDYFGPTVNRAARVSDVGHGGQIVLSKTTWQAARSGGANFVASARDLGRFRLKGLDEPEDLVELLPEDFSSRSFPPVRAAQFERSNLPTSVPTLVGRDEDLQRVLESLRESRLVTLLGPGGIGKTSLALAAGRMREGEVLAGGGSLLFVDLTEAANEDGVLRTVAQALDIRLPGGDAAREARSRVAASLARGADSLLILDNLEQVVGPAADLVRAWLESAPRLRILGTSREPLDLSVERRLLLAPLDLDDATTLFFQRAEQVCPGGLDPAGTTDDVRRLVERLDGIPLAVELAASRVGLLSPAKILARLESGLEVLKTRRRDVPERQRTLRATLEWSYDLLGEEERLALDAYNGRASARSDSGDAAGAIEDYSRSIELAPDDLRSHYNRGIERTALGDHSSAIQDFSRVLDLDPTFASAHFNRAVAWIRLGDLEEAMDDLTRVIELAPGEVQAHLGRGGLRMRRGDVAGALEDYDRAIQIEPDRWQAWAGRGMALGRLDRLDEASQAFQRALASCPPGSRARVEEIRRQALGR